MRLPVYRDDSAWHLFAVRVPSPQRDRFIAHMLSRGVSAGVHYKPLNCYPVFGPYQPLPVTDRVWLSLVTLPLYPDMTEAEQEQAVAAVKAFRP
jgi:dTDP-4-amino-4,6-dideoxygalactose transaminase